MGMSDDFEIAIDHGATILRLGRAIFESDLKSRSAIWRVSDTFYLIKSYDPLVVT